MKSQRHVTPLDFRTPPCARLLALMVRADIAEPEGVYTKVSVEVSSTEKKICFARAASPACTAT